MTIKIMYMTVPAAKNTAKHQPTTLQNPTKNRCSDCMPKVKNRNARTGLWAINQPITAKLAASHDRIRCCIAGCK